MLPSKNKFIVHNYPSKDPHHAFCWIILNNEYIIRQQYTIKSQNSQRQHVWVTFIMTILALFSWVIFGTCYHPMKLFAHYFLGMSKSFYFSLETFPTITIYFYWFPSFLNMFLLSIIIFIKIICDSRAHILGKDLLLTTTPARGKLII